MTFGYAILLMLGVVAVLVLLCLGTMWFQRNLGPEKYDERQQAQRGKAEHFARVVSFVYFLAAMCLEIYQTDKTVRLVDGYMLIFLGLMLQTMAFDSYTLLTDAALAPSEKPQTFIASGIALGAMYIAMAALVQKTGRVALAGKDTLNTVYLVCGFVFLFRGVTFLIRQRRAGKE